MADRIVQLKDKAGDNIYPIAGNPAAPVASSTTLGMVKVGTSMEIDANSNLNVNENGVTTGKIADGAVATAKIADSAVTSAKIADGTIAAADLASNSVTNAKIASGAVSSDKLNATFTTTDPGKNSTLAAGKMVFVYEN